MTHPFTIAPELAVHFDDVETITQLIFGPGMYARAAFRLREGVLPEAHLSFVALRDNGVIGSVRQTQIFVGDQPALLLGPLGVLPDYKNNGIGKSLMQAAISAAKENCASGGAKFILLVGDYTYYAPFGFRQVAQDQIIMPRPVDVGRTLVLELEENSLAKSAGVARAKSKS